ncbi:Hypothetical protein NTJ_07835 [Nesidiocoris tenuis]|uniref:Uncharacterized protein n=1 Tax=Nesidiocoris tenuis TaxID=355587 RepID=A0ABN7AVY0_9HEMI|nr:Hypothetical protein NTJ_07835 [Nesidiocoris tenuis]
MSRVCHDPLLFSSFLVGIAASLFCRLRERVSPKQETAFETFQWLIAGFRTKIDPDRQEMIEICDVGSIRGLVTVIVPRGHDGTGRGKH